MRSFVFSNHPAPRLARHLAFWAVYFTSVVLRHVPDDGNWQRINGELFSNALLDALRYFPIYAVAVYTSIYLVLPVYLRKKKLSILIGYSIIMIAATVTAAYLIVRSDFQKSGGASDRLEIFSQALNYGMANLVTYMAAAVIIKIMKDYWVRQRENELLAVENIRNKLDLLKMQMQPRILFACLKRIYTEIGAETKEAPEMILKLSDLLSYLLYESDSEQVSLSGEVHMIENYLALKRLEYKQRIDLQLDTEGPVDLHSISPGLLLPLLEIGIERSHGEESLFSVDVRLRATEPKIHFSLVSTGFRDAIAMDPIVESTLQTVRARLHSLKFQKGKIDFQYHANSLAIVLQLERNRQKFANHQISKIPT